MGLKDFFRRRTVIELSVDEIVASQTFKQNIFAIQAGINFIASNLANCEFQTVVNNKPVKGEEYYLWNVKPNPKQTKVEFIKQMVDYLFWRNEVLIVELGGWLYVADDFSEDSYALQPNFYKNIVVNNYKISKTFSENEVIHLKLNNTNMTLKLNSLLSSYKNLLNMATKKYKTAGGRKGIINSGINPQQSEEWNNALDNIFNKQFKDYFNKENAVVVLPEGQEYKEISGEGSKKSTSDVVDIIKLKNEVYTEVGRAMGIHPSVLEGLNTSNIDGVIDYSITYGVKPVADLIQSGIISARYGQKEYQNGNYVFINMSRIGYVDLMKYAVQADKLLADGVYSDDDLLRRGGELPRNTKESKRYYHTKNYEAEGGEMNGKED